ncbi:MAG: bacterial Ig-like domain-containing protein [Treponema sp.]|jgi:hypothetical protein|nr:bacterial Ig-like domain-containing protein [Treponema sp.]
MKKFKFVTCLSGLFAVCALLWVLAGCEQPSSSAVPLQEPVEEEKIEGEGEQGQEQEQQQQQQDSTVKMTGILIASPPETLYYALGQSFDTSGLIVEGLYNNDTSRTLGADEYVCETPDTSLSGPKRVRVRAGTFSDSFPILVNNSDSVFNSITVNAPGGLVRYIGQPLGTEGFTVTGNYTDGPRILSAFSVKGYDRTKRGSQTVTLSVNGKTAPLTVTVKVPADAEVSAVLMGTDAANFRYGHNNVFIRGQPLSLANAWFQATVICNNVTAILKSGDGISAADLPGFNPNTPGKQTLTLNLDEKALALDIYVADIAPEVYFDYGFVRHEGDPGGWGAGTGRTEGSYHTPPGKTLVLSPVRFLIGYDRDNQDLGVSYAWTVTPLNGSPALSLSGTNSEFLSITPQAAGTWNVSVTVTGRNFIDGSTVSKSAGTKVICDAGDLSPGTYSQTVKNFSPGQFTESGTGHGWSLGSFGGYLIKTVSPKAQYTIIGNGFGTWMEPGVVWFQEDNNHNNLPDEMWYELNVGNAGAVTRRYSLTYFKSGDGYTINEYDQTIKEIYWVDGKGRAGQINGGWPKDWGVAEKDGAWATYTGTLLGDTGYIKSQNYPDLTVWPNCVDTPQTEFPVSGAIAANGSAVTLTNVRFVKVHTGLFNYGGIFGEISTEIENYSINGTW